MSIKNKKLKHFVDWVNADTENEDYSVHQEVRMSSVMQVTEPWHDEANDKREVLRHRMYYYARTGKLWKVYHQVYSVIAAIFCIGLALILLMTTANLPHYGQAKNPANNEVVERYLEDGLSETGATNFVSGMILDYRAFDTLGESCVLFLAVCCVMILLRADKKDGKNVIKEMDHARREYIDDAILKGSAYIICPVVFLYGIYVILNGHLSAGGGFSGGAILGAGLILYANAFGEKKVAEFFSYKTYKWVSFTALITYAVLKCYSFYCGANHLESIIPIGKVGAILSAGLILPLNICVGAVVSCTMYGFYSLFRKGGI